MDRKKLNWNKNNIDIAVAEVEEAMMSTDDRRIYGWIRAILWAVGAILEELEKDESRNRMRADTDSVVISADGIDKQLIDTANFIIR